MTIVVSPVWEHIKKKRQDQHRDHNTSLRKSIVSLLLKAHCLRFHCGKYPLVFQGQSCISKTPSAYSCLLVHSMVISPTLDKAISLQVSNLNNQYVESIQNFSKVEIVTSEFDINMFSYHGIILYLRKIQMWFYLSK